MDDSFIKDQIALIDQKIKEAELLLSDSELSALAKDEIADLELRTKNDLILTTEMYFLK